MNEEKPETILVDVRVEMHPFCAFYVFSDGTEIAVEKTERFLKKVREVGIENVELTNEALSQVEEDYDDLMQFSKDAYTDYVCDFGGNPLRYDDSLSVLHLLTLPREERVSHG